MARVSRGFIVAVFLTPLGVGAWTAQGQTGDDTGGVNLADLRKAVGVAGANNDEAGTVFPLGVAFDLSGSRGQEELNGARLAAAQIRAAGGPKLVLTVEDIGTSRDWKGARAEEDLHLAGAPIALVGGAAAGGTMLPGLQKDHILAFDGDVGVPGSAGGQPYLWGLRANVPDDDFTVGLEYVISTDPKARDVALIYPQDDTQSLASLKAFNLALADDGLALASAIAEPSERVDEPSLVTLLKQQHPDAVYVHDVDLAGVLRAVHDADLAVPVLSTNEAASGSGRLDDYFVATDWFDATHPSNAWARLFVTSYDARFGTDPDSAAANAYEDTFAVWTLIGRVLARGGNINDGERLQLEVVANPAFKSIYGGDGTELDETRLDRSSHAVLGRSFAVYRVSGARLQLLATSDMGGANFTLAP